MKKRTKQPFIQGYQPLGPKVDLSKVHPPPTQTAAMKHSGDNIGDFPPFSRNVALECYREIRKAIASDDVTPDHIIDIIDRTIREDRLWFLESLKRVFSEIDGK